VPGQGVREAGARSEGGAPDQPRRAADEGLCPRQADLPGERRGRAANRGHSRQKVRTMTQLADVAVVGGGIVGLAFAWEAARRGNTVVLFDRTEKAEGASVRNFGMVWPIGQPPGEPYHIALRSRDRWLELRHQAGVWAEEGGSLHAVYEDDEDELIREFADRGETAGVNCTYLPAAEAARRFPALNTTGLKGVLHSPTELVVNPPDAIARLA